MVGRNHLWKHFVEPSLEAQVLENAREVSQIKEEPVYTDELVIEKPKEKKPKPKESKQLK